MKANKEVEVWSGQRKIPDSLRMAMQAAVDMGLSENQVGKLFNVPSATRVLNELRKAQENERELRQRLDLQSRTALEALNQSLAAQAEIAAL